MHLAGIFYWIQFYADPRSGQHKLWLTVTGGLKFRVMQGYPVWYWIKLDGNKGDCGVLGLACALLFWFPPAALYSIYFQKIKAILSEKGLKAKNELKKFKTFNIEFKTRMTGHCFYKPWLLFDFNRACQRVHQTISLALLLSDWRSPMWTIQSPSPTRVCTTPDTPPSSSERLPWP